MDINTIDIEKDIKYNEQGLIPAIIQDANSDEVLMMAYMNYESLKKTIETGINHFWSRSRQELWQKGQTSGNIQQVQEIYIDCDRDTLLIKVMQQGSACHTGNRSCFYKKIQGDRLEDKSIGVHEKSKIVYDVYNTIINRKIYPKENSYTCYLLNQGLDKILKKVGEESAEVIIAAKNRADHEVVYEIADLVYHLMVLLVEQDIPLDRIFDELEKRSKKAKE